MVKRVLFVLPLLHLLPRSLLHADRMRYKIQIYGGTMAIWLKCPECNGQGVISNPQIFIESFPQIPPSQPLPTDPEGSFTTWFNEKMFSRLITHVDYRYWFKGVLVALDCHQCTGTGYVPVSNLAFCSQFNGYLVGQL